MAEANEWLANFSATGSSPTPEVDGITLVSFQRAAIVRRTGTRLPFYPAFSPENARPQTIVTRLAAADRLEFLNNNLPAALAAVAPLTKSADPMLRGEALLRTARMERRLGHPAQALAAFRALGELDDIVVEGGPAGLLAHQGRALLFEAAMRHDDLEREAAGLCRNLADGHWSLSREQFDASFTQAQKWMATADPSAPCSVAPERFATADALDSAWREWQALGELTPTVTRTVWTHDTSVLLLSRATAERVAVLLMAPGFLQSAWLAALGTGAGKQALDFALSDSEGRAALGNIHTPLSMQSVRAAGTTRLPWTIHVISRNTAVPREISGQTQLVLAGIVVMAVLAVSGGWLMSRALLRELRVARVQSDFVAAVSHEFRTPLTTIRQLAEMLANGRVSNDERRQQFYARLLGESERLHRLVEGLLNFGRMEAGQIQYRFEVIDPEPFVRSVVSEFERDVAARGYRVQLQGNGALPPIRADRESLARVFWNLLDNAVKYSPDARTLNVDLARAGERVAVSVRDHGIGIPVAEQKEIFQKFVRGAASKEANIQGAGVGLSMARQIVAAHGGEISLESGPGEGSVFTVLLPSAQS